ncbi:cytochrome c [Microbulbifer hainanensis]|uniref:cytochrome c n=1 Tax=Microbulbifer hainanensis TaxID=2735675 RepID=UPI001869619E|nr:cytochrome c [Microbulbifer hainanensis]
MSMRTPLCLLLALCFAQWAVAQTEFERGRYLAAAGDCVACHTAANGRPFTGGRPFVTPFGTLYSTNITPDEKTGIGQYTLEQFTASMHRGKGLHGNLYPAMPYTSYRLVSDEDIAALFHYFMNLPAVENSPPANRLMFPANLRFGLSFWNWLYLDDEPLAQPEGKSAEWQRGNYLVNALGHCGECHTPRNFAFAMKGAPSMGSDEYLAGNVLEGWDAVDIRPHALRRQGWDRAHLQELFTTGSSERGTLFGEMYRVVDHSLRHLSGDDRNAIITYLLDESEPLPAVPNNTGAASERFPQGRGDFVAYCAGCHGRGGGGITLAFAPAMASNSSLRADSAHNAVAVILRGLPAQRRDRIQARAGMPSFHRELDDERVAGLVNFMRTAWGGARQEVTAADVAEIRRALDDEGYLTGNDQ